MSFFNIRSRNKDESGAISITRGADGRTAIYTSKDKENKKQEREKFLTYAAQQITPCERTFKQLEQYLIEKYQAVPHTLLPHKLNVLKANVILSHFDDVLDKTEPMRENPTVEDVRAYFLQAKKYPAEKLGLEFKAYKLSNVPSRFKHKRELKHKEYHENKNSSYIENDVIVEMEIKSQYISIDNGDIEIMYDLFLYRGVSEKDIREKNPRFMHYAYALKHIGKL